MSYFRTMSVSKNEFQQFWLSGSAPKQIAGSSFPSREEDLRRFLYSHVSTGITIQENV